MRKSNIFIDRPIMAIVMSLIITIGGGMLMTQLPIEQYPDITPPVVQVMASYTGADATAVDQSVATPLAQSIMGVDNMIYMQSTSANDGSLMLNVTFETGTDPDMNTVFTQNRVSSATPLLPTSVTEQGVTTQKTMNSFLSVIALYSFDGYDDTFLSNYAILNIKNELLKISGVGKVDIMGAGEYSMRIWVEPQKLIYYGITTSEISSAIEAQSGIYPVGKIGAEPLINPTPFTYSVVLPAAISSAEEYGQIVVRTESDGSQLLLRDIARIELGSKTYGSSSLFDGTAAAILAVYQTPGSNALEVGSAVKAKMDELSESFLEGIEYNIVVDTTNVISEGTKEIVYTLLAALLLVVLIVYLFIQDVRAMIIPIVAIPVSLIGAFMLFPLLGFTINVFSLLGLVLAIGIVVDDAIVVVEASQVGIEKGLSPKEAASEAMRMVTSPIIATTLVLIAVFVPVSLMSGITGLLYRQFAITISFSVIISTVNALTLSPALCSIWLRKSEPKTKGFFGWFNRKFGRGVDSYMSFTKVAARRATGSLAMIAISMAALALILRSLPSGFLPEEDQGFIMVSLTLPPAASLDRTMDVASQITEIVSHNPNVSNVVSVSGFNMLANIAATNSGIIFIKLKDFKDREQSATEIASGLNGELYMAVNGASCYAFGPPAIPGIGTASGFSMELEQKGGARPYDLEQNLELFLKEAMARPEIGMAYTQYNAYIPQKKLAIDKNSAMSQGVNLAELYSVLNTYLGGSYVNNFNRFGRLYQTYIQAESSSRRDERSLGNFYVATSSGENVPISSFVQMMDTTGVEYVSSFNLLNSATVMGSAAQGYSSFDAMGSLTELADSLLPEDMSYSWSGMSYQEQKSSGGKLYAYMSAIIFVFLLLSALYNSWTLPFSIILGIPLAMSGAALFVWIAHMFHSSLIDNIFFQVSLVLLIGLSAKNAILIIEYANVKFMEGASLLEAAVEAAQLRIRPILMTAFSFILGVFPLIIASGYNSIARNVMGYALVGGMFVATLLGLVIYPALYVFIGKIGGFEKKREKLQNQSL